MVAIIPKQKFVTASSLGLNEYSLVRRLILFRVLETTALSNHLKNIASRLSEPILKALRTIHILSKSCLCSNNAMTWYYIRVSSLQPSYKILKRLYTQQQKTMSMEGVKVVILNLNYSLQRT